MDDEYHKEAVNSDRSTGVKSMASRPLSMFSVSSLAEGRSDLNIAQDSW